ncbi:MAG: hypothetical protein K2W95_10170 [Candidatus Obscuribacterales bacterium]|nr:hypothetical protein [Candidatus Obscuribacterales bacterium]
MTDFSALSFVIGSIAIPVDALSIGICAGSLLVFLLGLGFILSRRHSGFRPHSNKDYLIRYLTDAQIEALKSANVPFTVTGNKVEDADIPLYEKLAPSQLAGVSISGKQLRAALAQLKATVVWCVPMALDDMDEVILRYAAETDEETAGLRVDTGPLPDKEIVSDVVREVLLPAVRKNIRVHSGWGAQEPISDSSFHVFFWSAAADKGRVSAPSKLCGAPVAADTTSWKPSGLGMPIFDRDGQFVVGELLENNLYLHPDILGQDLEDKRANTLLGNGGLIRFFRTLLQNRKRNPGLALLVRLLQHAADEIRVPEKLRLICAELNKNSASRPNAQRKVTSRGFSGRRREVIETLFAELLLPVVGTDIVVWHKNGAASRPVGDGKFHVMFHSGPTGTPLAKAPAKLFGAALSATGTSFYPSTMGLPLTDPDGYLVGELLNRNLYVGHELIKFGTRADAATLIRLLQYVREEIERFPTLTEAELEDAIADRFTTECVRQCPPDVRESAKADKHLGVALTRARKEYSGCLAATIARQKDWFRLTMGPDAELGSEFDGVLAIPKVKGIEYHKDAWLLVKTDTIFCTDPSTKNVHEIGAFDIYIPVDGAAIYWKNRTRLVKTPHGLMNAPHVNSEGLACLGSAKDEVHMLLRSRHYGAAIELAIAFVESVNVNDSWGQHISKWPVVPVAPLPQKGDA